jgi:hypothetical protein
MASSRFSSFFSAGVMTFNGLVWLDYIWHYGVMGKIEGFVESGGWTAGNSWVLDGFGVMQWSGTKTGERMGYKRGDNYQGIVVKMVGFVESRWPLL